MIAVLTADLVDSSVYQESFLNEVLDTLNQQFNKLTTEYGKENVRFTIYRGDSFQGVIKDPEVALKIALQIKTSINRLHYIKAKKKVALSKVADFKMAIGIGEQELERESVAESNGEAFQFSGRTLDEMKKENRKLRLVTKISEINNEFNASLLLLDTVTERWSTASAEVVYYLLQQLKEREVAKELNISQSAVNQRKKAAGWEAVSVLLERYQQVIQNNYSHGKS
ncbi:MAG: SatD family protein [Gillisia sp.]